MVGTAWWLAVVHEKIVMTFVKDLYNETNANEDVKIPYSG
jgi:hypothetical protein